MDVLRVLAILGSVAGVLLAGALLFTGVMVLLALSSAGA